MPGGNAPIDWLDRLVARIDRERLRGVEVVHADGTVVAVGKPFPAAADFVLRDVPEGREIDAQYRVNDVGRFLEELRFEDVMPASAPVLSGAVDKRVRVTTFDGLRIDVETVVRDGESFARLRAEVDEALAEAAGTAESGAGGAGAGTETGTPESNASEGGASEGEGPDGEAGADGEDAAGALHTLDDVRAEAERLNARWADRVYELPSFKRDYIARRIDELTRPLEDEDEGRAAGSN